MIIQACLCTGRKHVDRLILKGGQANVVNDHANIIFLYQAASMLILCPHLTANPTSVSSLNDSKSPFKSVLTEQTVELA